MVENGATWKVVNNDGIRPIITTHIYLRRHSYELWEERIPVIGNETGGGQ